MPKVAEWLCCSIPGDLNVKSFLAAALLFCLPIMAQSAPDAQKPTGVLPPAAVQELMPPSVFFSSQTATVQLRNSAGVRFADGRITLAGLVDTGGYSTSIRERYQFYLLTDAALETGGKRIVPGAYGAGFAGGSFVLMDLAGAELLRVPVVQDPKLQRPRPLQIIAGANANEFRLYLGREYVTVRRAK